MIYLLWSVMFNIQQHQFNSIRFHFRCSCLLQLSFFFGSKFTSGFILMDCLRDGLLMERQIDPLNDNQRPLHGMFAYLNDQSWFVLFKKGSELYWAYSGLVRALKMEFRACQNFHLKVHQNTVHQRTIHQIYELGFQSKGSEMVFGLFDLLGCYLACSLLIL